MAATVLMLHIEPTPYVLGFIRHAKLHHDGRVDSVFIATNVSQPWNLSLEHEGSVLLPSGFIAAAMDIIRRVSSGRYRLLHLAGWGHPLLFWALIVGGLYRMPVIIESDTQIPAASPLWKSALKRLLYPSLFRIPRAVLPSGTRQGRYFRQYGVPDDRIVIARMTVDVTEIARRTDELRAADAVRLLRKEFGLAGEAVVFVFVGRLEDPRKGIRTLLAAFAQVSKERSDMALLVVGDGTARSQVEVAAAANPSIRYLGRLDWDATLRARCCSDAAVVPSMIEPFGLVVNEAMASGLPVIASDQVGCIDDLVHHGTTGLVFQSGNVGQLANAMRELAESKELRERMGAEARRLISTWTLEAQGRIAADAWGAILVRESHR